MEYNIFEEQQRFTQWWLWLLLLGIGALPIIGIYQQLILGKTFGNKPMSDTGLIIFAIFTFLLLGLFYFMRLETKIDRQHIYFKFYPFLEKKIAWEEVKSAEMVDYGFVGYGIRIGTKYGTVYNTKGSKGLAIRTRAGKKLCLGTQKTEVLAKWLAEQGIDLTQLRDAEE
ncbi:MAG: hypothetical protein AB8G15_23245 [Saprospiraceae bacterium]